MNGTIRVGNLFGIPFYIHPSWFLVLGLVTWTYSSGLMGQFPQLSGGLALVLGLMTALLLFASVVAHELGHSFVAIRQGIDVKSITLFIFGGLASLEKESKTPGEAFWVAIAGPLVSLLICGLTTGIGYATAATGPLAAILGVLAAVNLALALFNLIPGLPLDGGNILKALVWKITGNPYKGVTFASRVGQIFGWVAIASGLLPILFFGSFANIWNLLIGFFLLQNAGNAAQFARVQEKLTGLTAADVVTPNSPIVSANLTLREFADERILSGEQWHRFLVTDDEGQLVGAIAAHDLRTIPTAEWSETQVKQVMRPIAESTTVQSDKPLVEVVQLLEQQQISALPVIRENGVLVGILEKAAIIQLLQRRSQFNPA
ncbi:MULTISPECIES: site-2 protease family protein [unclassified Tolypothrix]|uniref:site-2 protease family protein n=1 Tax=unclassified Tolypothrix TaxID=2649714 RepID=UPI0005EAAB88|nr:MULTISPECIES: site-2 protease family protein [unclassified Tolypothrix]BAY90970.1 peptidase M50 [Microchaete diplosiphon NIES-3275]EKE99781.1 peptidase, M50 family [Tolypothrix sp. PCC 7601]MBE9082490.1 site-2 protease family protein [Tolypothrix sp. LEGE 11397]UYD25078.1 site-2 protease family protein [Tolypothrix sp. PCC 7712]UYD32684.1 site-2 protease family protein [Tolypothrix sp. PCC 7601]